MSQLSLRQESNLRFRDAGAIIIIHCKAMCEIINFCLYPWKVEQMTLLIITIKDNSVPCIGVRGPSQLMGGVEVIILENFLCQMFKMNLSLSDHIAFWYRLFSFHKAGESFFITPSTIKLKHMESCSWRLMFIEYILILVLEDPEYFSRKMDGASSYLWGCSPPASLARTPVLPRIVTMMLGMVVTALHFGKELGGTRLLYFVIQKKFGFVLRSGTEFSRF